MTAIATRRLLSDSTDSLLRFALRLDATLSGLLGLALAAAAGPLSALTGFTPTQEYITGAALVLYGVVVYCLAALNSVRQAGIGVVLANLVCTVAAVAVVVSGALPLTGLGVAALLASATYTAAFAVAQYLGVRRLA
ncbi:hypothetical protein BH11ACT6_BH11ACT6_23120 [soil metagenome]